MTKYERYNRSEKGKARYARYRQTEKGRAAAKRGNDKFTESGKHAEYMARRRRRDADARDQQLLEEMIRGTDAP